jgi:aryl-alcohol dehydrogenase-like predicted oxidoreductase
MEYRNLGRTGVAVSPLCFGTDCFADPIPEKECAAMMNRAIEAGINLFDTGDSYAEGEGERIIGRTLKENGLRHSVLLATKCDHGQRRPGLTLDEFVPEMGPNQSGPTRLNMMLSTHPAWAVMEAILLSEFKGYVRIATEQPPYNLLDRRIENELLPMAQKFGLGIITWSPLAMGILAGVYDKEGEYPSDSRAALRGGFYADRVTAKGIEVGKKFSVLAKEAGLTSAQLGLLWCKDQPGITAPLIGPETMEHLEDSLPVLEMTLSDELREACDNLVPPGSNVANFHNTAGWMKAQII